MKKVIFFITIVILLCVGTLISCFAAYSYPSAPGKTVPWDFSGDKSYTLNGECDIYYYRGSAGFLGIGSETSKARSCTKAIPYWYSTCIAAIRSSSGKFYASYSGIPDTSNTEIHSGWADANSTDPAQYVQYEYAFFQVSNDMAINTRRYFYASGEGLTKTE